eukprot:1551272-Pyramimonas_sp.AAC.1
MRDAGPCHRRGGVIRWVREPIATGRTLRGGSHGGCGGRCRDDRQPRPLHGRATWLRPATVKQCGQSFKAVATYLNYAFQLFGIKTRSVPFARPLRGLPSRGRPGPASPAKKPGKNRIIVQW